MLADGHRYDLMLGFNFEGGAQRSSVSGAQQRILQPIQTLRRDATWPSRATRAGLPTIVQFEVDLGAGEDF
jgi:hypothetical protein